MHHNRLLESPNALLGEVFGTHSCGERSNSFVVFVYVPHDRVEHEFYQAIVILREELPCVSIQA